MARKIKYGKIAIVIFLTALIWIWADMALDETLSDRPAIIEVDESVSPKLWVSFNKASEASIKITLSGPHAAIANENRRLREGKIRKFVFDVVQEKMDRPGNYALGLLPFLQKDKQIKQLGLKLESCDPEVLDVNVVELVRKSLPVQCFDEDGMPRKAESIEPPNVNASVPPDRTLVAKVRLTSSEIEQARVSAIEKKPYIELPGGQTRDVATMVKVKMPPAEDVLRDYTIGAPKFGIVLSLNLQGRYKVDVINVNEVISPIKIRATPTAKQAYESMRYQVILEIDDEDAKLEESRKEVVYNFPKEFFNRNEIVLSQAPARARFKLMLLSTEAPVK